MKSALTSLLAMLAIAGCETRKPTAPPIAATPPPTAAVSAPAPSTTVAASAATAPPPPTTASAIAPPLARPSCPTEPARAPVSVVVRRDRSRSYAHITRIRLATPDKALAASLLAFEKAMDNWIDGKVAAAAKSPKPVDAAPCRPGHCQRYAMGCYVVRNDGEFLSARCYGVPLGHAKYSDETSFLARRVKGAFVMQGIDQLLPKAPGGALAALSKHCEEGRSGDEVKLDWFTPQIEQLYARFEAFHPSGGNCWVPFAKMHAWHGCSSLMAATNTDGASPDVSEPPMSFALGAKAGINPYSDLLATWTPYATRATLAAKMRQEMQAFVAEVSKSAKEPSVNCSVTLSTPSIFSAMCYGSGQKRHAFNYRLDSGKRIDASRVLVSPSATKFVAKTCTPPKDEEGRKRKIPKLTVSDLRHFSLMQNGVSFEVPIQSVDGTSTRHESCFVPFASLSTNLMHLSRP